MFAVSTISGRSHQVATPASTSRHVASKPRAISAATALRSA